MSDDTRRHAEWRHALGTSSRRRLARRSGRQPSHDGGWRQRHRGDADLLPGRRPVAVRQARRVRGARHRGGRRSWARSCASTPPASPSSRSRRTLRGLGTAAWRRGFVTLNPHVVLERPRDQCVGPADRRQRTAHSGRAGHRPPSASRPPPMRRRRVRTPMKTGVKVDRPLHAALRRAADRHLRRLGRRQIHAARMLARSRGFDTVVIALVGERGREVREFMEDVLGRGPGARGHGRRHGRREPDDAAPGAEDRHVDRRAFPRSGRERPAPRRFDDPLRTCCARGGACGRRAARSTRLYAERVQRPAEAAGAGGPGEEGGGSITGFFSVLVDGDDHNDPVADSIRGTLDGHIVLDRAIADQARYPAVNVLARSRGSPTAPGRRSRRTL